MLSYTKRSNGHPKTNEKQILKISAFIEDIRETRYYYDDDYGSQLTFFEIFGVLTSFCPEALFTLSDELIDDLYRNELFAGVKGGVEYFHDLIFNYCDPIIVEINRKLKGDWENYLRSGHQNGKNKL